MNKLSILSLVVILTGLLACNPMKNIEATQTTAYSAYENGNYAEALNMYEKLMDLYRGKSMEVPYDIIVKAGKAAYKSGNLEKAQEYLTKAFDQNHTFDLLELLVDTHKKSNESDVVKKLLEENISLYEKAGKKDYAYTELFKLDYAAGNFEAAYEDYKHIADPSIDIFPQYLSVLNELGNKKEAEKECKSVLMQDENSVAALEWLAVDEYNKAEDWYNRVMDKYNKNKNATTYAYLRRDLKKISAVYRASRDMFIRLRELAPENKMYIKYLKNIYLRLSMKDKAKKMNDLLKK